MSRFTGPSNSKKPQPIIYPSLFPTPRTPQHPGVAPSSHRLRPFLAIHLRSGTCAWSWPSPSPWHGTLKSHIRTPPFGREWQPSRRRMRINVREGRAALTGTRVCLPPLYHSSFYGKEKVQGKGQTPMHRVVCLGPGTPALTKESLKLSLPMWSHPPARNNVPSVPVGGHGVT